MTLKVKPGILDIKPYIGGKSRVEGVKNIIKLSSNENPYGPSRNAIKAYIEERKNLYKYPDGSAEELRQAIGQTYNLDPKRIVCGAGSDELISLLCLAYAGLGDEILFPEHGFLMYHISAKTVGATPVKAKETNLTTNVDELIKSVTQKTKIVFIANPNNPTGSYINKNELIRLRQNLPENILLVIDGAYAEYVEKDDYTSGEDIVDIGNNTVMTRTFSKLYGLASLRLGWAYCPLEIADILNRVRGPFNVNSPAIAAGIEAVKDINYSNNIKEKNNIELEWLSKQIKQLNIKVYPSIANFILCEFPDNQKNSKNALNHLMQDGIIVRGLDAYNLEKCLRVTIGTREQNIKVLASLTQFINQ